MQKRTDVETIFKNCRSNLLLLVALSGINVILTIVNSGITFLFSATFPTFSVEIGKVFSEEFGDNVFFVIGIVIAFIVIAFYGICYLLSKKYKVFILVALVLFVFDTMLLLSFLTIDIDFATIIDIVFHAWVIYCLAIGVKEWANLKKMPLYEDIIENEVPNDNQENDDAAQTP